MQSKYRLHYTLNRDNIISHIHVLNKQMKDIHLLHTVIKKYKGLKDIIKLG